MKIKTQIKINAAAAEIWKVLIDTENYDQWNPFIIASKGQPKVGHKISNTMKIGSKKPQVFDPTILVMEDQKEFRWVGHLFVKGLFDGEHYFQIEEINANECILTQGEIFSGLLAKAVMSMIKEDTIRGFEAMNHALKEKVENIKKSNAA